jgi:hypothetical protein
MGEAHAAVDSNTEEEISTAVRSKKKAKDQSEAKVQTNTTAAACCGNQLAAEASAGAWRFQERTAVAVDLRQHRRRQLLRGNERERQIDGQTGLGFQDLGFQDLNRQIRQFIYKI